MKKIDVFFTSYYDRDIYYNTIHVPLFTDTGIKRQLKRVIEYESTKGLRKLLVIKNTKTLKKVMKHLNNNFMSFEFFNLRGTLRDVFSPGSTIDLFLVHLYCSSKIYIKGYIEDKNKCNVEIYRGIDLNVWFYAPLIWRINEIKHYEGVFLC